MTGQGCGRCQDVASTLGCIRRKHDAVKETKKRSDEGRCHHRPVVTLTNSARLVNRSLPVQHAGVPISIISKRAGPYDSAFTQKTYVHASEEDLQRGQAALAKIHKIA